jgi:hypothetical protein
MDTRVKPAYDESLIAIAGIILFGRDGTLARGLADS